MPKHTEYEQSIRDLYNSFSNEDLERILFLAMGRVFVFNPNDNNCYGIKWVSMNGNRIQITLEDKEE
jgi:tricorn protease-like protein